MSSEVDYQELKKELIYLNRKYHGEDVSIVSDAEYDKKYVLLKKLEKERGYADIDSPTQTIGTEIKHGRKVKHLEKMYSLDNVFTAAEHFAFFINHPEEVYACECKIDGMSGDLIYIDGKLSIAATRGENGLIGENITENVLVIENVPKEVSLKETFDVRGEFVIHKEDFATINDEAIKRGLEPFKTLRNLVAGTMRQLDPKLVIERKVRFYAYGTSFWKDKDYLTRRKTINDLGFDYVPTLVVDGLEAAENTCDQIRADRETYPFEIDGAVVKINSAVIQQSLGYTSKDPRWAVARKWNREGVETRLVDVEAQVGRTGVITPVGKIEPIDIGGVTVTSATLHNYDVVKRLGVAIGNKISVIRGGDVIPKIESVILESDNRELIPIKEPTQCPVCNSDVLTVGAKLYCSNKYCFGQKLAQMNYFVSREAMNIQDLSEQTIKQLVYKGFVQEYGDFYKLTKKELLLLDGFKDKSAEKLLLNIHATTTPTLEKFITALGIPNVGIKTAQNLAKRFKSIYGLMNATLFDLIDIRDIGEKTATDILMFIQDSKNIQIINNLLTFVIPQFAQVYSNDLFKDLIIVITGGFNSSREEITDLLERYGAKVSGSVSNKTTLVITGINPGDNKVSAAIKYNVRQLDYSGKNAEEIVNSLKELLINIQTSPF